METGEQHHHTLESAFGAGPEAPRSLEVSYRISPLGAHTDHQQGLTCGFTIDHGVRLDWRPSVDGVVRLVSRGFKGAVTCDLQGRLVHEGAAPGGGGPIHSAATDWSAYPCGVVRTLADRHPLATGIEGVITGSLPPGGISTSAALQIAVMKGLLAANDLRLRPMDGTLLIRDAEQGATGVQVGLLDPAVILHGKKDAIVFVDCRDQTVRLHRFAKKTSPMSWYLIDSGVPRDLRSTPYNERVEECRDAARRLGSTAPEPVLRDVTPEEYRRRRKDLPPHLIRRVEHYFSEVKRVKLAMPALARGDVVGIGRLIRASAESLTNNFECGVPQTRQLLEILNRSETVYGATYAGAGWGGLVQVLAQPGSRAAMEVALEELARDWPEAGARARIWEVGVSDGSHGG